MTPDSFAALPLAPALSQGLDALGYTTMTPVQARGLPLILAGRDVIARAPTGSGKTAAFGLGLLQRADPTLGVTQALVLCPTRELAQQVAQQLRTLATGIENLKVSVLCGGIPLAPQLASLVHAPHVVVGTPGRLLELVENGALDLTTVRTLVLDEADRMLDMGFEPQIRALLKPLPRDRQGLLFSATLPDSVHALARSLLRDAASVEADDAPPPAITHRFVEVPSTQRAQVLAALLLAHRPTACVAFCNMRRDVDEVCGSLQHYGFAALALHGEMEQRDREEALVQFANGSATVLVATDVAARGLDIESIDAVVNVDVPTDADTFVHRIGRTGRAGREGRAWTLCDEREQARLNPIVERLPKAQAWEDIAPVSGRPRGVPVPAMATLRIDAGRTDKLRPGDIVGALTGEAGLAADAIGKIAVQPTRSYVAVRRGQAEAALAALRSGKIKGRRFRVHKV